MKTATLRLTILVSYDLNGATIQELKENLAAGAEYLAGIGKFTQDTEAEVTLWDETVDTIHVGQPEQPPPAPEDPLLPIAHSNYDGVRCPLCKAEHTMEGRNLTATDNGAEYEMECNECGATWSEQLDVTGYTYLCDKEGNEIKIPE